MNNDQDIETKYRNIINRAFGADGFNADNQAHRLAVTIGLIIANANREGSLVKQPIIVGVIAHMGKNAKVRYSKQDGYVIGLNHGLVQGLYDYAHELFCNNFTPDRNSKLAVAMFSYAISFIIEHEFAHISNGHLGLMMKNQVASYLSMQNDEFRGANLDTFDILALEMDADAMAVSRTIYAAISLCQSGLPIHEPLNEVVTSSQIQTFENVTKAIAFVITYLGVNYASSGKMSEHTHFPTLARLEHAGNVAREAAKHLCDLDMRDEEAKRIGESIIEENRAILDSADPNWMQTEVSFIEEYFLNGQKMISELHQHFANNLKPRLKKHAWHDMENIGL